MNILDTLRTRFSAALAPLVDEPSAAAGAGAAEPGRHVRRLPGQLSRCRWASGWAGRRARSPRRSSAVSTSPTCATRPRSPAPVSSTCGSATTGCWSSSHAASRDADRLGVARVATPRTFVLDYSLAERRQADARGPHPLDRHRRRALPHAAVPRPLGDQRQPHRRLGHPVRHDHLRLQALRRRGGAGQGAGRRADPAVPAGQPTGRATTTPSSRSVPELEREDRRPRRGRWPTLEAIEPTGDKKLDKQAAKKLQAARAQLADLRAQLAATEAKIAATRRRPRAREAGRRAPEHRPGGARRDRQAARRRRREPGPVGASFCPPAWRRSTRSTTGSA